MMLSDELTVLLHHLKGPDSSERRSAAEALGQADERAIYPLLLALRDENPGVQDAAMRSLIDIGGEVTAYMTLPLLREGPFLRNTARVILKELGRSAVPLLRPLLTDKDDDVRTFSVDLIADIGWCDYPAELARLLGNDQNQNVRASAARAIGVLGYREALPVLRASLKDEEWVCFSALESLALLRDESSVDPVLALIGGPSETLRYAAIEALGKIGSPRSSAALADRIPRAGDIEKIAIAKSLIQIGISPSMTEVADVLIDMFTAGEWEDKLIALSGLADLKDSRFVPVILEVAGSLDPSEPDGEERLIIVKQALAKFGCIPGMTSALADPSVRFHGKVIAIEVLGELRCAEAVPHLIALMDVDVREIRRAAVLALAEIRGGEALRELQRLINDRDGHVRHAAIDCLGRIGDKQFFAPIAARLNVENYKDVRAEAVQALVRIDAQALFIQRDLTAEVREMIGRCTTDIEILLRLSRDAASGVRQAALLSLGQFRDDRAREQLSRSLADGDPAVRKTAVTALAAMNAGVEVIGSALQDHDRWVRLAAVRALGDSGRPEAAQAVIGALSDREPPVVLAAIDALIQLGGAEAAALDALRDHPDAAIRARVAEVVERV